MKTKNIFTALLCSLAIIGSAQSNQTREITPFKAIDASGASNVYFTTSDTLSLSVEGDADELPFIETKVQDNILFIKTKGNFRHPFKIKVAGNNLSLITLSGAASFKSNNDVKTDSLTIEASGAANMDMPVSTRSIRATISGASDVSLWGNTQNINANVSGASSLKAYKLNSLNTNVTASGASSAKVFSSQKIVLNATGASTIKFKGEPKDVSAEGSSASQIIKIGDDKEKRINSSDSTTTSFNWGRKKIIIIDGIGNIDTITRWYNNNKNHKHWEGFFMGSTGFLNPNKGFQIAKPYNYMELDYSRCFNYQFNLSQYNLHLYKRYINLVTGFGFDINQYQFENKTTLNADSSFTFGKVDSTAGFHYNKNRLYSYAITVPLLLDFNTSKRTRNNFHISTGVVGEYLLGARTKQVYNRDGQKYKNIRNDGYNINPFRFNAYASIGYRNVTLYAQYALNPMFKANHGPELYPFSVGIRLVDFD